MKTQQNTTGFVFANDTCSTATSDGLIIRLQRGQVWDAADVLVQERPWHFITEPAPDMLLRTSSDTLEETNRRTVANWPAPGVAS
jgi:hypothetical protein